MNVRRTTIKCVSLKFSIEWAVSICLSSEFLQNILSWFSCFIFKVAIFSLISLLELIDMLDIHWNACRLNQLLKYAHTGL